MKKQIAVGVDASFSVCSHLGCSPVSVLDSLYSRLRKRIIHARNKVANGLWKRDLDLEHSQIHGYLPVQTIDAILWSAGAYSYRRPSE
jgi:hypothetical protein